MTAISCENLEETLLNKLISIINGLSQLTLHQSYEIICFQYKQLTKKIIFTCKYLKAFKNTAAKFQLFKKPMVQLVGLTKALLNSGEPENYGHRLPLLYKIINKYEKLLTQGYKQMPEEIQLRRNQKNEESYFYRQVQRLTKTELTFLESKNNNKLLTQLRNEQVILPNPQCLCCLKVFIKDFQIENANPLIKAAVKLNSQQGFDFLNLQKILCAVSNEGGGVIIIGSAKKNGVYVGDGIRFENIQKIVQIQNKIMSVAGAIKPEISCKIERVLVHTNYINCKQASEQFMRICFRIFVSPKNLYGVNFLQVHQKGSLFYYQPYKLNQCTKAEKIVNQVNNGQSQTAYQYILHKFRKQKKSTDVNNHKNIKCFHPYTEYSKIFKTEGYLLINEQEIKKQNMQSQEIKIFKQTLNIKYRYAALLIASSKKQEREIQNFQKFLHKLKVPISMQKPFPQTFQALQRNIWLISFQINYIQLKQYLKIASNNGAVKQGLTMMPVYRNFQIQCSKAKQSQITILQNKFYERFQKQFKKQTMTVQYANQSEKEVFCFYFSDLIESIFAYLMFQSLKMKPYFFKQANDPKKQNKTTLQ